MSMVKIQSVTLGANQSAVTFSNIPQTFKSLWILCSTRSTFSDTSPTSVAFMWIAFNGGNYPNAGRYLLTNTGSAPGSGSITQFIAIAGKTPYTANTFTNNDILIQNYAGSTSKAVIGNSVSENNAADAYISLNGVLWNNSAAITSITLSPETVGGDFVAGSTFYLYALS